MTTALLGSRDQARRALALIARSRRLGERIAWRASAAASLAGVAFGSTIAHLSPPGLSATSTQPGGWPIEAMFGLGVAFSAVVGFQAMEILFRARDARPLATLPVHAGALLADRLGEIARHAARLGAPILAFAVGVALASEHPGARLGPVVALTSIVVGPLAAFAAVVLTAAQALPDRSRAGVREADPFRMAAAFQSGAAVAFTASVVLLLLVKLGIGDIAGRWVVRGDLAATRAGLLAVSAALVPVMVALPFAVRAFLRNIVRMQTVFAEAEAWRPEGAGWALDNAFTPKSLIGATPLLVMERVAAVELARAAPFARLGAWAVGGAGLLFTWASGPALAVWFLAPLGILWVARGFAPENRIRQILLSPTASLADALAGRSVVETAVRRAGARECLAAGLPLLLPVLATLPRAPDLAAWHVGATLAGVAVLAWGGSRPARPALRDATALILVPAAIGGVALLHPGVSALLGAAAWIGARMNLRSANPTRTTSRP